MLRTLLALILAVVAGVLSVLSMASMRLDALVHTPEPLQEIAGPVVLRSDVQRTLPQTVSDAVEEQMPGELPGFLRDGIGQLIGSAASGLLEDERFAPAWSASVEETRANWTQKLEKARQLEQSHPDQPLEQNSITVEMDLGPILTLGQDVIVENLREISIGEGAADVIEENAPSEYSMPLDLNFPDAEMISPERLLGVEGLVQHWRWMAVAAGVSLLLALLVAPGRRRLLALGVAGLSALGAAAVQHFWLESLQARGTEGVAQAVAEGLIDGLRGYAQPDSALLMGIGAVVAVIGFAGFAVLAWRGASRTR